MTVTTGERKRHCQLHQVPVITTDDYHVHSWTAHGGLNFACCWQPIDPDPTWERRRWLA
jgi:hypothetical protein